MLVGVVGILGSTYTGEYEDIEGMDRVVSELNEQNGWNVGIHVDAASGGFIAPFVHPELPWDFRLKNVVSINVSGHKYGLVYPVSLLYQTHPGLSDQSCFFPLCRWPHCFLTTAVHEPKTRVRGIHHSFCQAFELRRSLRCQSLGCVCVFTDVAALDWRQSADLKLYCGRHTAEVKYSKYFKSRILNRVLGGCIGGAGSTYQSPFSFIWVILPLPCNPVLSVLCKPCLQNTFRWIFYGSIPFLYKKLQYLQQL